MIYTNLLDNLPAIIGLLIAGLWLIHKSIFIAYRLDIITEMFSWLKQKSIIIPSLLFIISPFVSTSIFEISVENVDNFIKAFTPITCVAAYIAYQQYQINRQQLRKSLSEKRLEIYVLAMTLFTSVQMNNSIEIIQDKINSYLPRLFEAEFLFGEEVNQKLREIYDKANELVILKKIIDETNKHGKEQQESNSSEWYNINEGDIKSEAQRNGEKLNICTKQIKEIRKWFEVQTPSEITSLFYPYINLSNIGIDKNKN
ncbi:hypothetical protein [Anabaena sp. UHCC 0451]|uniref:hypothetical protein n=1 Tax=Anabaena sp. UHCC 0451 TaxID=2055235 RepID=UPI002B21BE21|nr:hypothetical protein [Anabaena sp. UHCC 0451]MEA5578533.1 hypothetical protein [Anabaena sp. UHCC 0451]